MKLNKRQNLILDFILKSKGVQTQEIKEYIDKNFDITSRITIIRDLENLSNLKFISKAGEGRAVRYFQNLKNQLLKYIDIDEYFKEDIEKRDIKFHSFNFDIFENLKDIFSKEEKKELEKYNKEYKNRLKKLSPGLVKKEIERLTIELSWKSSKIEGNTYSLLDTENLIKENKEAKGHKREEAIMILNHKKAFDFILDNRKYFKTLSIKKIEDLHSILINNMGVSKNIRKGLVAITGTNYKPLDNSHQIRENLEKSLELINKTKNTLEKSLIAILMISYIQAFEDGNKRTSRMIANAILISNSHCPLSYRNIDEDYYKKAIIIFYEQNIITPFKELFIEQFKFATENYFR